MGWVTYWKKMFLVKFLNCGFRDFDNCGYLKKVVIISKLFLRSKHHPSARKSNRISNEKLSKKNVNCKFGVLCTIVVTLNIF